MDTAPSGCYCDGLADAILRGLAREAKFLGPLKFAKPNKIYYMHPSTDEQRWKQVLDEIEQRFSNTYKKPFNLGVADPLFKEVEQLVPWQLERA